MKGLAFAASQANGAARVNDHHGNAPASAALLATATLCDAFSEFDVSYASTSMSAASAARQAAHAGGQLNSPFEGSSNSALAWSAATEDATTLGFGTPLWGIRLKPDDYMQAWAAVKKHWQAESKNWSFWIEWYQRILEGNPMDWNLTFKIATEISEKDWEAGQARVAERIEEIRAVHEVSILADDVAESAYLAQPGTPGIGHNNPPSLLDDDLPQQPPETIIWVAADELRTQAIAPVPDMRGVRKAVGVLIGVLVAAGKWTGQKVDKAVDAAAGAFGKAFGVAGGATVLTYVTGNGDKIAQLIDAATKWLSLVF